MAVAANAAVNLGNRAPGGHVHSSCALVFVANRVCGARGGSVLGKVMDGQSLLRRVALNTVCASIIIMVALYMLARNIYAT